MTKLKRFLRSWGGLFAGGGGLLLLVLFQNEIRAKLEVVNHIAPLLAVWCLFCILAQLFKIRELLEDRLPPDRLKESFDQFMKT